jgi:hypothetical protein
MEGAPPPAPRGSGELARPGDVEAGDCPRCGTPYFAGQEYCLECGLRLPHETGVVGKLGGAWRRRVPWYPGDWVWAALLGLAVAAVAAAVVVVADRDDAGGARLVATGNRTVPTTETTAPETETTASETTRTSTGTTRTTATTARTSRAVQAWPPGRSGYTVVLNSIPTTAGRSQAVTEARRAIDAGLEDVGVLESSDFSTLHPGYYVVFSGFYTSSAEATEAISAARNAGFKTPYPRQIAR